MGLSSKELNLDCPLNKTCNWEFLYKSSFQNFCLPIYICTECKLQTIFPKKDPKDLYNEGYYTESENYSKYQYKDERKGEKYESFVWKSRIKNIKKFVKSGNFLDIGSSFGGFLNIAKISGFQVEGVEISEYSSGYANQRGIKTHTGQFLDQDLPKNHYDVITLIEVLEHLENPKQVFNKLYSLLNKNGLLLIQTANFEGKQAVNNGSNYHYYLPGHFYYYSKTNLMNFLKIVGFNQFKIYYGVDISLLSKLRKSMGSFNQLSDYWKWIKIAIYHWKSKIIINKVPLTSSFVLYAIKD